MLDVIATIAVKPDFVDAFERGLRDLLAPTRAEEGCVRFEAYTDGDAVYCLVERWRDEAALQAHYEQPYVRRMLDNYGEWLSRPLEVRRLTPFPE